MYACMYASLILGVGSSINVNMYVCTVYIQWTPLIKNPVIKNFCL